MNEKKISVSNIYEIGNFSEFSIIEIFILYLLSIAQEPIIRHSLYLKVNELLQIKKKISTSSFYNSLKSLKNKGFIEFIHNKRGKITLVKSSALTKKVITVIFRYFVSTSSVDDREFIVELSQKILERIGASHFNNLLTVEFSDYIELRIINFLQTISDNLFVLCRKESYNDLLKIGVKNLNFSEVYNKMIREPDNLFDIVLLSGYIKNPDFYKLTRIDVLKEALRVTRFNGSVVIVTINEIPITQHNCANEILNLFRESSWERTFNEKQLKEDMIKAGFSKIDIFNYRGMLVGIGGINES